MLLRLLMQAQAFSPDSRWLITTAMDSIIRTYDIPTGRLIDAFRTASIATSISFSPTGDFLATSHVDSVGVFLWCVVVYHNIDVPYLQLQIGQIVHNTQMCLSQA